MPIINQSDVETGLQGIASGRPEYTSDEQDAMDPSVWETTKAAFRQENVVASWWSAKDGQPSWLTGGSSFDPSPFIPEELLKFGAEYDYAENEAHVDAISAQLRMEMKDREVLANSGVSGMALQIGAGFFSPETFVPVVGVAGKAAKAVTITSKLKAAGEVGKATAKAGFVGGVAAEAGLQPTQRLRTAEESAINIAASTVMSGLLGSSVGMYKAFKQEGLVPDDFDEFAHPLSEEADYAAMDAPRSGPDDSAGSMRNPELTVPSVEAMTFSDGLKIPFTDLQLSDISKLPVFGSDRSSFDFFNTPDMRVFGNSMSKHAKHFMLRMVGSPMMMKGHETGELIQPSILTDTITIKQQNMTIPVQRTMRQSYKDYVSSVPKGDEKPMDRDQFSKKVFLSAHSGVKTGNPHIDKATEVFVKSFEDAGASLKEMGKPIVEGKPYVAQQQDPRVWKKDDGTGVRLMTEYYTRLIKRAEESVGAKEAKLTEAKKGLSQSKQEERRVSKQVKASAIKRLTDEIDKTSTDFDLNILNDVSIKSKQKSAEDKKQSAKKRLFDKKMKQRLEKEVDDIVRQTFAETVEADISNLSKTLVRDGGDITSDVLDEAVEAGIRSDSDFGIYINNAYSKIKQEVVSEVEKIISKKDFSKKNNKELSLEDVIKTITSEAKKVARSKAAKEAKKSTEKLRESIGKQTKEIKKLEKDLARTKAGASRQYEEAAESARQLADRISGLTGARDITDVLDDVSLKAKGASAGSAPNLKARSIDWSQDMDIFEQLVDKGYIISDVEYSVASYSRTALADIETAKFFGGLKFDDLDIVQKMNEDYQLQISNIQKQMDSAPEKEKKALLKEQNKIKKQWEADRRDTDAVFARLTGRFHTDASFLSSGSANLYLKTFNNVRFMGGVVKSSLTDVSRILLADASAEAKLDAIRKIPVKLIAGTEARKEMLDFANKLGTSLNSQMIGRAHNIADVADGMRHASPKTGEQVAMDINSEFYKWNGMNWWNDTWQGVVSEINYTGFSEMVDRASVGKLKKFDLENLRKAGFSEDDIPRLKNFMDTVNIKDGAIRRIDLEKVDGVDDEILDKIKIATLQNVDTYVVNPKEGDKPIFISGHVGSLVGQYHSFGYSSLQKSTLLYSQRLRKNPADLSAWTAMMGQMAFAGIVVHISLWSAGRLDEAAEWSKARWLAEMADRSGLLGSLGNNYNVLSAGIGGIQNVALGKGYSSLSGQDTTFGAPMTRFQNRNFLDQTIGASGGLFYDIPTAATGLGMLMMGEQATRGEYNAMYRLLPMQNFLLFGDLAKKAKANAFEEFDVPKSRPAQGKKSVPMAR